MTKFNKVFSSYGIGYFICFSLTIVIVSCLVYLHAIWSDRPIKSSGQDLYFQISMLQDSINEADTSLWKFIYGRTSIDKVKHDLAIIKSKLIIFYSDSEDGRFFQGINGYGQVTSKIDDLIKKSVILDRVSNNSASKIKAQVVELANILDDLKPIVIEFAVDARFMEVNVRERDRKNMQQNWRKLVYIISGVSFLAVLLLVCAIIYNRRIQRKEKILESKEQELHALKISSELEQINQLGKISHELKSPMQAIENYAALLEINRDSLSSQQDNLLRLRENIKHLLNIVHDILDISRLKNRKLTLIEGKYSIQSIMDDVVSAHKSIADKNNLMINVTLHNIPSVIIDGTRVKQIVWNLVANAVRYTEVGKIWIEGRIIHIGGRQNVEIIVGDTGIGVDDKIKDKVFLPFVQGYNKPRGSSGLGLSIVSELVNLLGGNISFSSKVGIGTVFTVHIPVEIADSNDLEMLLVEDDPEIAHPYKQLANEFGCNCVYVSTEEAAITILNERKFSFVLLDLQLENGNGFNVALSAKSSINKNTPIIAITAYSMAYEDSRADLFDEKLCKPIGLDTMKAIFERYGNY